HLPKNQNNMSLKDTNEDDSVVHIVMELCEGGELFDTIVTRGHYTERAAAFYMKFIVWHKHGVIYRDLKPENFLFANKKESSPLKAIDFGLLVFFRPSNQFKEIVGSPYYMAPEVLKRNYGREVYVWNTGVILYILLCGVLPFWAGLSMSALRVGRIRDPWPKVFENAKNLVKKLLNHDPKQRLTAEEVLEHPWLQNAKKAPNVSLGETVKARLKQFSVMNKLKKRALQLTGHLYLQVVAEFLSVEEVAGLKEAFEMMDTNKRGKINLEELRLGLLKGGQNIPEADLQILMDAISIICLLSYFLADVDGDGSLNYGEFVAVSVHLKKMANDEHLHKAFSFFDRNQSGFIETEELQNALNDEVDTSSENVINAIMHDVDTDKISVQYMNSKVHVQ
ncbi:hypothetical protein CICLE_v10010257mg, partial [Citrus x clementina]